MKKLVTGVNDLQTVYPDIASEWDYTRNGSLKPTDVTFGSGKRVWWIGKCGHSWDDRIDHRTSMNCKCPYCAGQRVLIGFNDLNTKYPDIAKEWHPTKNGDLTPNDVLGGSDRLVWWLGSCGHSYETSLYRRTAKKSGCPYCGHMKVLIGFNDLQTLYPEVSNEWHPTKNGALKPCDFMAQSNKKVWWICKYGHEWKSQISSRTSGGSRCPLCSGNGTSLPEQGIAFYLEQVCKIEQRTKKAGMEVDVFLPEYNIGIEYDGKFYHSQGSRHKEIKKDEMLMKFGVRILRIKESKTNSFTDGNIIYYIADKYMGSGYESAIQELCKELYKITGNERFNSLHIDINSDILKIRERFNLYMKEKSLSTMFPDISSEWNYDRNGRLTPDMFIYTSTSYVWWKCSKGHEWKTKICYRTGDDKTGCPFCSGRRTIVGETDLQTLYPEIAQEWNTERNGDVLPNSIKPKCATKYWWKCSKGHEWSASPCSRVHMRSGCPYCSHTLPILGETDLQSMFPEISKEWHPKKNGDLKPSEMSSHSNKKVWWICSKGHEWQAIINNRTGKGSGCPYCSKRKSSNST